MKKLIYLCVLAPTFALAIGGAGFVGHGGIAPSSSGLESAQAYTDGINTPNAPLAPSKPVVYQQYHGDSQQIEAYRQGQTVSSEIAQE